MVLIILIFTAFLIFCYCCILIYYRIGWNAISDFVPVTKGDEHFNTFITVIVPVRNEEENILSIINAIQNQEYPSHLFEIIIVDDHSTDDTIKLASPFVSDHLQLISINEDRNENNFVAYKKRAIEMGIEMAKGTLIITTDADCTMKTTWLKTIAAYYELYHPEMIVMPVSIKKNDSFLGAFQTLDFMSLQGITAAAVYKKIHGMCNGANLAYTKKVFYEVNRFEGIDHIASGDDMLLMHKISKKHKDRIHYLKSKEVIVETQSEKSISDFINQRIRWASKADKYEDKSLFPVLLLVYLLNLFLVFLFVWGLYFNFTFYILHFTFNIPKLLLASLFIKTAAELLILYPVSSFFGNQQMLWLFPLIQPFHILYTVIAGWFGKFGTYQWKGRKLK
jgi:glycosyltransferase involved in cell wall biosynthesis